MVASVVIVANVVVVVANDEVMNCADDVSHKSSQKFHLSSNAKNFCLKNTLATQPASVRAPCCGRNVG